MNLFSISKRMRPSILRVFRYEKFKLYRKVNEKLIKIRIQTNIQNSQLLKQIGTAVQKTNLNSFPINILNKGAHNLI